MADLSALILTLVLIGLAVLIHFQALRFLSLWQASHGASGRLKVLVIIFGLIAAHVIEAGVFAGGYWAGERLLQVGQFVGPQAMTAAQYFYFAIETFTTQGVGDLYPVGPLRLLASLEPLAGLILIGWSTSFTFLVMGPDWRIGPEADRR